MSAPDLDQLYAGAADEAAVDGFVRRRFGVEPQADPSGLAAAVQPAPTQPADAQTLPVLHQGPRLSADPTDAVFDAVMATYFPQAVR